MFPSKEWWSAAGKRALKTLAQSLVAMLPAGIVISAGTDWASAGWTALTIIGSALFAAALSLLRSLAGLPEVKKE